jgi:hypothetical protein
MSDQLSKELTGVVIALSDPKAVGASNYPKAEIVLRIENGQYPQEIPVEAGGKKANLFIDAKVCIGDTVKLQCNITGRKGGARWYPGFSAWKCELLNAGQRQATRNDTVDAVKDAFGGTETGDDSIPF